MEECCICFNEFFILISMICKHSVCINCHKLIKKCPFCRQTNIKKEYDANIIFNIIKQSNYLQINCIVEELKYHNLSNYLKMEILLRLCEFFSNNRYPFELYKFNSLLNYYCKETDIIKLMISYNFSNDKINLIQYLPQYINLPCIFDSKLSELDQGSKLIEKLEMVKNFKNKNLDMNKKLPTKVKIQYLDTKNTIIELENDIIMNLMQYYIYSNDFIILDSVNSKKIEFVAKCSISLYNGLNKDIKNIAEYYHLCEYDNDELLKKIQQIMKQSNVNIHLEADKIVNILWNFKNIEEIKLKEIIQMDDYYYEQIKTYLLSHFDEFNISLEDDSFILGKNINIFIKYYKDEIPFTFHTEKTIKFIKSELNKNLKIHCYDETKLILKYNDEELQDNKKLKNYNINSELKFELCKPVNMSQIFIRSLIGHTFSINAIIPDQTIKEIKFLIEKFEGIEKDLQRLIFTGRQLENDNTLGSYNIEKESILHLFLEM